MTWSTPQAPCQGSRSAERARRKKVIAYCTHGAVRPGDRPHHSSSLDELVVTDTIPLSGAGLRQDPSTCAPLLAETFKRIIKGDSVISPFVDFDSSNRRHLRRDRLCPLRRSICFRAHAHFRDSWSRESS
jgi:hypothetical protein